MTICFFLSPKLYNNFCIGSLEPLEQVVERRMAHNLLNIMENSSHPLHSPLVKQWSCFSHRLLQLSCDKGRYRKSFLPVAITLFNDSTLAAEILLYYIMETIESKSMCHLRTDVLLLVNLKKAKILMPKFTVESKNPIKTFHIKRSTLKIMYFFSSENSQISSHKITKILMITKALNNEVLLK